MDLEVVGVTKSFGALRALEDIDLTVASGQSLGVIGPNGSGKTTLFNCISGFVRPDRGVVSIAGTDVVGWSPHRIARHGLVRTFQQQMVFSGMSVSECLSFARDLRRRSGTAADSFLAVEESSGLRNYGSVAALSLPYGEQRKLGLVMAVAVGPGILALDEPAAGLAPTEQQELISMLRIVVGSGTTLIVVDHNMGFLLPLVVRVAVLDAGRLLMEGAPEAVAGDPRVIATYLGGRYKH
jgi:branched-chain amino acid transport system permease protein